jgi:hypothetical protein
LPVVSGNVGAVFNGGTVTSQITAPDFKASGLTGATAASRYVGATASGAPASGTFAVGDFVIDQTGKVFICTVAGTPGTWAQAGATFDGGTITQPLTIARPSTAAADGLNLTVAGEPNARINAGVAGSGAGPSAGLASFVMVADGTQLASLALEDQDSNGFLHLRSDGTVFIAPHSAAADGSTTLEVTDQNEDDRFVVFADGTMVISKNAATADGNLSAGQMAIWFDQTNGAAKLMVKGKSANGTVVAGAIALA